MKIVCDSCGAKYSIADEKVRGKVFKIRCKKCSDVIVVKGQSGEESASEAGQDESVDGEAADAGYEGGSGVSEWYAVVDGDQVGPITPDEVESYYNQGTLDDGSYAWREGLEDWQRLDALEEFSHLTADSAGPEDETVVAAPGDESGAGDDVAAADEKTVVTEPGQFDFEAPDDAAAAGGDFSEHSGEEDDGSPSVEISDDLAGEFAGDGPAEQSAEAAGEGALQDSSTEQVGSEPAGGGSGLGGQTNDEFADSGGFDAQTNSGSGDFAAQNDAGGGDAGSFESFGEESTQSGVSGTSNQPADGGTGGQQGPDMSSDDMIGQRSENSVLFSLSSVDEMKAVDGPEEEEDVSGAGATTEGSGLIDIQNLASSHAAMSSEEEESDGGAAPVDGPDSSPSPSPAGTNNQQLSNDSVNMPSLAPSGSRGNNTGLIIAVIIGGFILLSAVVVATVLYLNRGKQTKKIVEKKTKAAASATESTDKKSGDDTPGKDEKTAAESGDDDKKDKDKAADKGEDDGEKESAEDEEKKADKQDEEEEDESEEESTPDDETEVARNDNDSAGGGSGGDDRGRTGSAAPTRSDNSGGGGGGGGDDDSVDELLDNVDNNDESSGSGGGAPEKDLKEKPTRSMVKSTIGKYSSRISTCASEKNRNDISGTLFIKFEIQPSGRVSGASIRTSKFKGTDVGKCVQRVVSSMKFPETKSGMPVKFPFRVE